MATQMRYKALFLDVDGTIVPYHVPIDSGLPSEQVTKAIQKASEKVEVCLATGRPYFLLKHVLEKLNMKHGYAVINDGAQVMDLSDNSIIYEQLMDHEDIVRICDILSSLSIEFFINDNEQDIPFTKDYKPYKPYNIFTSFAYEEELINKAIDILSDIPTIKVNKTHGGRDRKFSFLISHAEATKLHGIYEVGKKLHIKRPEIIGVGDSGNDFPLLMASGLKVAMGNAIDDLKAVADFIAPTVEEDGVATVIEKFILHNDKTKPKN